jgi:hypothetical protein
LRRRLKAIFEECQALGESGSSFSWEGAILRVKVERSAAAINRFKEIVFETVSFK